MDEIVFKILPPIIVFFIGYLLKNLNILKREDGDLLLKLVFYVAAPSLILTSLSTVELNSNLFLLVLAGPFIVLSTYGISLLVLRILKLNQQQKGVFLIASMIMNTGFLIPFVLATFDQTAIAMFLFFDAIGGIFAYTFIYSVAINHGTGIKNVKHIRQKLLLSPSIWAVVIALLMNIVNLSFPPFIQSTLTLTGGLLSPLIMLSLGIYFTVKVFKLRCSLFAVALRMFVGLSLGLLFCYVFQLDGAIRTVILFASAAPVGFNTLTFSSLEHLDKEFAASIISLSLLIALLFIPLLLILLKV